MANADKTRTYSPTGSTKKEDRVKEIQDWSMDDAMQEARSKGFELTINHKMVLAFLRHYYIEYGWPKSTYVLTHEMSKAFADKGGNRFLHQLFPDGPIAQGTQLAGVPVPDYAVDKSFGSAY